MSDYQKQHYLPCGYLQYFSIDQGSCNRKSHVWRFDGSKLRKVPVESQNFKYHFYSKLLAEPVEAGFHEMEGGYCRIVNKIRAGEKLTRAENLALLP